MNITELIVAFIQEGKSVEIPGIGTLKSVTEEAHLDPATKTFFPKRNTISLSDETSGDKSILNLIAEKECVNTQIAQMMWNNYVDALTDKLKRTGGHTFPGLGDLKCTSDGFSFSASTPGTDTCPEEGFKPIENIKTYDTDDRDPFAVFEGPIEPSPAAATTTEPEKDMAESSSAEPVTAPQPTPEPIVAEDPITSNTAVQEEPIVKTEEIREPTIPTTTTVEKATDAPNTSSEQQTPEQEPESVAPEPDIYEQYYNSYNTPEKEPECSTPETGSENKGPLNPITDKAAATEVISSESASAAPLLDAQNQQEQQPKQESVVDIFRQLETMPESAPQKTEKKKSHTLLWILLILLILLLGGAAFYFFKFYYPTMQGGNAKESTSLSDGKSTSMNASTSSNQSSDVDDQEHSKNADASDAGIHEKISNIFSYSLDLLEFSPEEIGNNRDKIHDFMSEYISQFLSNRHYLSAKPSMMERIDSYSESRLTSLLDNSGYSVERFFHSDDFLHNYLNDNLKSRKASRARVSVQESLLDEQNLDEMLQMLISELDLKPDDVGIAATNKKPEVKKSEQPVVTAQFASKSKRGYDIIAGFYTNRNSATQLTEKLKSLGCDAYIIDRNGLYYVSMGSASTQTAAESLYNHLKSWYSGDIAIRKL